MAPPYLSRRKDDHRNQRRHVDAANNSNGRITKPGRQNRVGRPNLYSSSWIKKLVLLRECGFENRDVIRILGVQGGAHERANLRTAQSQVRMLLGEPGERYMRPDELTARRRASFLKRLLNASDRRRSAGSRRSGVSECISMHSISAPGISATPSHGSLMVEQGDLSGHDSKVSTDMQRQERLSYRSRLSRNSVLSICPSLLDELKRFSRSTFSSTLSAYTIGSDTTQPLPAVADVFEKYSNALQAACNALNQKCCSRNFLAQQDGDVPIHSVCVHLRFYFLKRADPDCVVLGSQDIKALLGHSLVQRPLDAYGNSELFFAARTGAPVDIMIYLIENTVDLDAVNADGQTFLFFLNSSNFRDSSCNCTKIPFQSHSSSFECIIRSLESRGFDFDHLDHNGCWFLHYLLYFKAFNLQWLVVLISVDSIWRERVHRMHQMRDSAGLFLADFMFSNPSYLKAASPSLPFYPSYQSASQVLGQLMDEDSFGRTRLHRYIRDDFLHAVPSNTLVFESGVVAFINRYNFNGRTPAMEFLEEAIKLDFSSPIIIEKLKVLVQYGANVNARSRGGNTLLHFAAGKARAEVVRYLLTTSVQKDHRDNQGRTAYDHAFHIFKHSRKISVSAKKVLRSFQSLAVFDDENGRVTWPILEQRSSRACDMLETLDN
ncbi:Nn.00g116520.m01.CDS01 [Neocucurbitaria sp. VM-36]